MIPKTFHIHLYFYNLFTYSSVMANQIMLTKLLSSNKKAVPTTRLIGHTEPQVKTFKLVKFKFTALKLMSFVYKLS